MYLNSAHFYDMNARTLPKRFGENPYESCRHISGNFIDPSNIGKERRFSACRKFTDTTYRLIERDYSNLGEGIHTTTTNIQIVPTI